MCLLVCMYCAMCAQVPKKHRILQKWNYRRVWATQCGYREWNPGPLQSNMLS